MRLHRVFIAFSLVAGAARAQTPESAGSPSRVQSGVILGIAMTGLSVSNADETSGWTTGSGNATSPYVGFFVRRSLTPSTHASAQAVFDLKGDDGARYAIPYVQLPLQLEVTPFAPRGAARWVRPVLIAGGSGGIRLSSNGGAGPYQAMRPFEFSVLAGLGVEAHFRTRDWVQIGFVAQHGLTDLQPGPGKTSSFSVAAYVKAHPGAMRR